MKKIVLVLAAALAFASCNSTKVEGGKMEKSKKLSACTGNWQLVLLMKDGVAQTLANADLTIADKGDGNFDMSGFMGANRFMGAASSSSAGQIKAGPFASTRRGASKEIMEFETLFSEFLDGVDSYSVGKLDGHAFETLILKNSAMNAYAHFSKNSVFDTLWKLNAINEGNAVTSVSSSATMTLEKNSASVFTGINQANLGVRVDEGKSQIAFSEGPMTLAAGSEEDMRTETLLMQNLFKVNHYSLSGGSLSLYDGETLLLEFEKQDWVK